MMHKFYMHVSICRYPVADLCARAGLFYFFSSTLERHTCDDFDPLATEIRQTSRPSFLRLNFFLDFLTSALHSSSYYPLSFASQSASFFNHSCSTTTASLSTQAILSIFIIGTKIHMLLVAGVESQIQLLQTKSFFRLCFIFH
jgi:hypothetical protein